LCLSPISWISAGRFAVSFPFLYEQLLLQRVDAAVLAFALPQLQ
jgi:hypothetical protein